MAGKDYSVIAGNIVDSVGGKDNIQIFTHCLTRLRFTLKDKGAVKAEEIEKMPGVVGIRWAGNQIQVIIGQDVADVYKLVCKTNGLKQERPVDEDLGDSAVKGKKKFSAAQIFASLSGCIPPLLPMLIGGGMIKAIILALSTFGLMDTASATYQTLNFVSNAPMYFLPVMIGYTGARQFGANPSIGMMLGAILIHPTLIQMATDGVSGALYGIGYPANNYSSSIFPMILTMFICGYVERFFAKYSPKSIRSVVEPVCTILVMTPIMLTLLAPLGSYLSTYLGIGVKFLYDTIGPWGMALFAAVSPFLVMTGMHLCLDPYTADALATTGRELFVGLAMFVRNFNQGIACLVVACKTKKANTRSLAISCAISAIGAGVTEPALFGINLKYRKALYSAMIGSFFGGLYAGFTHVARFAYGGSGIFGLVVFVGDNPMNLINEMIAVAISAVITFAVGMFLVKTKDIDGEAATDFDEEAQVKESKTASLTV